MAELEKNIKEKLVEVFKEELDKDNFELNYLITDDVITFFFGISDKIIIFNTFFAFCFIIKTSLAFWKIITITRII